MCNLAIHNRNPLVNGFFIKKEGSVYKEVATDGIRDLGGNNLTDYREGMHFVDEITLEDISYEPGNRYFIVFHIEEDGTPRIEIIIKDKNGGEKRFDYEVKEEKNLE